MKTTEPTDYGLKFSNDLSSGQIGERIVGMNLLKNFKSKNLKFNTSEIVYELKGWDFSLEKDNKTYYFEVKTDLYEYYKGYETGNIFIETLCNNKLSGLSTTTANYFCYYFPLYGELWIIPVKDLRREMKENPGYFIRRTFSGDNGKVKGYTLYRYNEEYNPFKLYKIDKNMIKHFPKKRI